MEYEKYNIDTEDLTIGQVTNLRKHDIILANHHYPGSLQMGFHWIVGRNYNNDSLHPLKNMKKLNQRIFNSLNDRIT